MTWIDFIQITLLIYLIERVSVMRNRYKLMVERGPGYWALWVYCKKAQSERYYRSGGKKLLSYKKNGT